MLEPVEFFYFSIFDTLSSMNPISNGYQKLLSSYKELEEINSKMVNFVQSEFPEDSTLIAWGAVTYGSYVPGRSDFDFIIVLEQSLTIEAIREKIRSCYEYSNMTADDLDLLVIDRSAIERGDYLAIDADEVKRLDDMDFYIINHFGKVLHGDPGVVKLFPGKELDEFYPSSVRAFRKAIQIKVLNKLAGRDGIKVFIEEHIVMLMLMYRVLFTYLNKEIWGKIESINWVMTGISDEKGRYLKHLGVIVREVYLKNGEYKPEVEDFGLLVREAIAEFLELTAETETKDGK